MSKSGVKHNFSKRVNAITTDGNVDNSDRMCCWYCSKRGHPINSCSSFLDLSVNNRWRWLKSGKWCFKCLGPMHHSRSCKAPPCNKNGCGPPHHNLFHSNNSRPTSANNPTVNSTQGTQNSS